MSVFEAVFLGAVQGLTEFLPVSSSGHLVLFQKILGIAGPALFFDTLVHGGTLIAVFAVLWRDIWDILRRIFQPLTGCLVLATLPAVAAALVFGDAIEEAFASGSSLGFAFLATSVLLVLAEYLSKKVKFPKGKGEMNWLDALVIGVLQALAIVPGLSRSGSTLSGALSRGLNRDFAARFSFLLSIPAILGALVLQTKDLLDRDGASGLAESGVAEGPGADILPLIAGTLSAALVGFFSIRIMLRIIRKRSLLGFAVYTGLLGILVLIDRFGTHLVF
ncbi:MAG: undecaprenyl-diphosphate phosphatase [Treponema sp.]|jgi:undecaprenyl-diphosphatase|nr:undecaprenyl-diphosphate phosphatase [Treponema sp.]